MRVLIGRVCSLAVILFSMAFLWADVAKEETMAEPLENAAASADHGIVLKTDVLGWDVSKGELRRVLRERGVDAGGVIEATRGFRSDDRLFSMSYGITNGSADAVTVFGRDTVGLGTLPMVTGDEHGGVRLLITTELDPNIDFVRQPFISGTLLAPGETRRVVLSMPYPFEDRWRREKTYDTDDITFCVGLTTDTKGVTADSLGEPGVPGRYWPMGKPSPITVCETLKR